MSAITVARVESRIQSFVLGPLWCCFLVGALISAYYGAWWTAGAYVILCFYIGWIGKNLGIHRGKGFAELSEGILISIPSPAPGGLDELSTDEMRPLVSTMVHALYTIALAVAVILLTAGIIKFYWVILICIVLFYGVLPLTGVVVQFMSINRGALRRKSDDDTSQRPSANP